MNGQTHPQFEGSRTTVALLRAYAVVAFFAVSQQAWLRLLPRDWKWIEPVSVIALGVVQLFAVYSFASWFKGAYSKLSTLGVQTRYTPAMAVALFLIPFASLYKPAQLVRELYAGSDPGRLRPNSKRRADTSRAATSWWYLFLISSIVGDIAAGFALREGGSERGLDAILLTATAQLLAASAALGACRFVLDIRELQRRCALLLRLDKKLAQSAALEDDSFHRSGVMSGALRLYLIGLVIIQPIVFGLIFSVRSNPNFVVWLGGAAILSGVLMLAAFITFLTWVHRIITNLRRALPFSTTPGSAVLGFFVPVINLIHAWDLLQTIWKFLDRVGAGIRHYDSSSAALTKAEGSRSFLIDVWWLMVVAQVVMPIMLWQVELGEAAMAYAIGSLVLSVLSMAFLQEIVAGISRKMNAIEEFLVTQRAAAALPVQTPLAPAVSEPAEAAKRSTWTEVLLPIAATIDEGVRSDPVEERRQRERVELAKDAERENERAERIRIEKSTFHSAKQLTKTVRVLLLLAIFVGFGEAFVLVVASPRLQNAVALFILLCFGALPSGLPAWVTLSRWAYAQWRNAVSLALLADDPSVAARRIFLFGEPAVMHDLWMAATQSESVSISFRIWHVSLRLLQFAPLYLAYGVTSGDLFAMSFTGFFVLNLLTCLTLTAGLVREIDNGLSALRDRASSAEIALMPAAALAAVTGPPPLPGPHPS